MGLLGVDTTTHSLAVMSTAGTIRVKWDYKFPFSAQDGVIIVVFPAEAPLCQVCYQALDSVPQEAICVQGSGMLGRQKLQGFETIPDHPGDPFAVMSTTCNARVVGSSVSLLGLPPLEEQQCPPLRARCKARPARTAADPIPLATAALFVLGGNLRCAPREEGKTLAQTLEEEWGIAAHMCRATINGRSVSLSTTLTAAPVGIPVRICYRLKGGVPNHTKRLRELLLSKGVPEDEVASRLVEINSAIGDAAIQEAFTCFDPWQALKSKCHGKLRIIKQTEARHKAKKGEPEDDHLQYNDPWAEALQQRQLRPDPSFFQTASKDPPAILHAVSHGCTGLAIVDDKEARLLSQAEGDLSPDELSIIVMGRPDFPDAKRPQREIQFPCLDSKGNRLLAKGTLIDLGAIPMRVAGEDSVYQMAVVQSACVACEVQQCDFDEWQDLCLAPIKQLKKTLNLTSEDILHTWGRKFFRGGKVLQGSEGADALFVMLRIRATALEGVLKATPPGLYMSPRLESGEPDHAFKVVWCPEKTVADVRVLAQSTPGCQGIVKSRTGFGVRVRCADFCNVKARLCPDWVPQPDTPYTRSMPYKYELHHVHPGASKGDLQLLLNTMKVASLGHTANEAEARRTLHRPEIPY